MYNCPFCYRPCRTPLECTLRVRLGRRWSIRLINAGIAPRLLWFFIRNHNLFGLETSYTCEYYTFYCYAQLLPEPIYEAKYVGDKLVRELTGMQRYPVSCQRYISPGRFVARHGVGVSTIAQTISNALSGFSVVQGTVLS